MVAVKIKIQNRLTLTERGFKFAAFTTVYNLSWFTQNVILVLIEIAEWTVNFTSSIDDQKVFQGFSISENSENKTRLYKRDFLFQNSVSQPPNAQATLVNSDFHHLHSQYPLNFSQTFVGFWRMLFNISKKN